MRVQYCVLFLCLKVVRYVKDIPTWFRVTICVLSCVLSICVQTKSRTISLIFQLVIAAVMYKRKLCQTFNEERPF
jgi:hypothetical protein